MTPLTVVYSTNSDEVAQKLMMLNDKLSRRTITKAQRASAFMVRKTLLQKVPKGDKTHKTYLERYVSAGFTSRNIVVKTFKEKYTGTSLVGVGVHGEAFYASQFIEKGFTTSRDEGLNRKVRQGRLSEAEANKRATSKRTKVKGTRWMEKSYLQNERKILTVFSDKLNKELEKIAI